MNPGSPTSYVYGQRRPGTNYNNLNQYQVPAQGTQGASAFATNANTYHASYAQSYAHSMPQNAPSAVPQQPGVQAPRAGLARQFRFNISDGVVPTMPEIMVQRGVDPQMFANDMQRLCAIEKRRNEKLVKHWGLVAATLTLASFYYAYRECTGHLHASKEAQIRLGQLTTDMNVRYICHGFTWTVLGFDTVEVTYGKPGQMSKEAYDAIRARGNPNGLTQAEWDELGRMLS